MAGKILKWLLWIAGIALFAIQDKLYFAAAVAMAVACGFLIKKYIRRIPAFSIPAVCLLIGNMYLLLMKMAMVQEAIALLVADMAIVLVLIFCVIPKPAKPRVFWLMFLMFIALFLDYRLFEAFDHTGYVNKLGFEQMIVRFYMLGFLISVVKKLRRLE